VVAIARRELGSIDATNFSAPPEPVSGHIVRKRPNESSRKRNRLHRTGLIHGSHTQPISPILHHEANRTGDTRTHTRPLQCTIRVAPAHHHSHCRRVQYASCPTPHNTTTAKAAFFLPLHSLFLPRTFSDPHTPPSPRTGQPVPQPLAGLDDYCAQHRDDRLLAAALLPQRRRRRPAPGGKERGRRRQRERHRRAQLRHRAALPLGAVPRHPGTLIRCLSVHPDSVSFFPLLHGR
jgi:hypothetical protein